MVEKRLVLASNNAKKIAEIQSILANINANITVITQTSIGVKEVAEDGLSFVENALIKARHAAKISGLPAIADDSGLEVDAINGAPGIYSARYAGDNASDADNNKKLLTALTNEEPELNLQTQHCARFYCVIVYLRHELDPTPLICTGAWQGHIVSTAQGENGFGYDPLFYVPSHHCTSAQLAPEIKSQISHRGQALRLFSKRYRELIT